VCVDNADGLIGENMGIVGAVQSKTRSADVASCLKQNKKPNESSTAAVGQVKEKNERTAVG
jgi:hypothetical protein